jgi:hypothetical protein
VLLCSAEKEEESGSEGRQDSKHFVTIIPVGYPGFDVSRRPFYSKEMDSPEFSKLRKFVMKGQGEDEDDAVELSKKFRRQPGGHRSDDDEDSDSELVYSVQVSLPSSLALRALFGWLFII